jgi:hypothetical protein
MRIPDDIRKCVVFVGYQMADESFRIAGTGFLVSRDIGNGNRFAYLVTAGHVVNGIKALGIDKVHIRINLIGGDATWIDTDIGLWVGHPDGARVVT